MNKNMNPLDWHGTKFLETIPLHFSKVKFRHSEQRAEVLQWIEENIQGRFAIESVVEKQRANMFGEREQVIGFENPAEATMYAMFYS